MVQFQNRKMPSLVTVRLYICLAVLFATLAWLEPLTGLILTPLAIALASVGILSIPRLSYPKALLLALIVGAIPAGILYFLTRMFTFSVAAFAIAPAIALFVLTVRRRHSRSAGIHWMALALTLFYAGAAILFVWEWKGGFSAAVFKEIYAEAKAGFLAYFDELPEQYASLIAESGISISDLFQELLYTLPGFIVAAIWAMAWLSTTCLRWIFNHYVYGADRFANWPITMPKVLAWIFIISFVGQALPTIKSLELVSIILGNLYYVLTPAFFLIGCQVIKNRLLLGCGCSTYIVIALVFFIPVVFIVISLSGAFRTISPKPEIPFTPMMGPNGPQNPQDPENPDDQGGASQ